MFRRLATRYHSFFNGIPEYGASRRLLGFNKGAVRSDSLIMARFLPDKTSILNATKVFHLGGALESITAIG